MVKNELRARWRSNQSLLVHRTFDLLATVFDVNHSDNLFYWTVELKLALTENTLFAPDGDQSTELFDFRNEIYEDNEVLYLFIIYIFFKRNLIVRLLFQFVVKSRIIYACIVHSCENIGWIQICWIVRLLFIYFKNDLDVWKTFVSSICFHII